MGARGTPRNITRRSSISPRRTLENGYRVATDASCTERTLTCYTLGVLYNTAIQSMIIDALSHDHEMCRQLYIEHGNRRVLIEPKYVEIEHRGNH
jgi:hypothetical protein